MPGHRRSPDRRRGAGARCRAVGLECAGMAWMTAVAAVAVTAGGAGLLGRPCRVRMDSVIEFLAAPIVAWQLLGDAGQRGSASSRHRSRVLRSLPRTSASRAIRDLVIPPVRAVHGGPGGAWRGPGRDAASGYAEACTGLALGRTRRLMPIRCGHRPEYVAGLVAGRPLCWSSPHLLFREGLESWEHEGGEYRLAAADSERLSTWRRSGSGWVADLAKPGSPPVSYSS